MRLKVLEKCICVLKKSWKIVFEKGYEPCLRGEAGALACRSLCQFQSKTFAALPNARLSRRCLLRPQEVSPL